MKLARTLVNRQWWWVTLLVMAGMLLLARLGIWQLDRLAQRRASNAVLAVQLAAPPLELAAETGLPEAPVTLRNRLVVARGAFDFSRQIILDQQRWQNQLGVHLIAPLVLPGGEQAVLVDRGWVPAEMADPAAWTALDEPGEVTVTGYLQPAEMLRGRSITPASPQLKWFRVDILAIQAQMPYALRPFYILQAPDPDPAVAAATLPRREAPDLTLSEGPHLGYALQWFSFALLLGGGYLVYVQQQRNAPDS